VTLKYRESPLDRYSLLLRRPSIANCTTCMEDFLGQLYRSYGASDIDFPGRAREVHERQPFIGRPSDLTRNYNLRCKIALLRNEGKTTLVFCYNYISNPTSRKLARRAPITCNRKPAQQSDAESAKFTHSSNANGGGRAMDSLNPRTKGLDRHEFGQIVASLR
jgi:hypothetical protein